MEKQILETAVKCATEDNFMNDSSSRTEVQILQTRISSLFSVKKSQPSHNFLEFFSGMRLSFTSASSC